MMKISFSTLACPTWTMQTVMEQAHTLGYDGIELRFIENADRLWELPSFQGAGLKETRHQLDSTGLSIACVDTSCFFHFAEEAKREESIEMGRSMIELAASLGAPGIRIFGDRVQAGADLHTTAGWVADGIHQLAEFAKPAGVEVWIESHGNFAPAAATLGILRAANAENIGIIWDPLNAYCEFFEHPSDAWKLISGCVRHVHVKDARRTIGTPPNQPWEPVLVGQGDAPVLNVVNLLRKEGYQRFVSYEWEKRWHPQIEDPEIALPHFIRWIRAALAV